jgi:endoglucanase
MAGLITALIAATAVVIAGNHSTAQAAASFKQQCTDPYSSARTAGNPLMVSPAPPASDPLQGANLFVDGPAHGAAAGEIARLLGIDASIPQGQFLPAFSESESWSTFSSEVASKLSSVSAGTANQIRLLEKIATEPETQRISTYSEGGTPAGIYSQAQKLYCHLQLADPHSVMVISTYFLHPNLGSCATTGQINAYRSRFDSQIDALAQATGNRPVVFLLELDAIGSSSCMVKHHSIGAWESALRYEAQTLSALPHTVVYIEGGYSDANTAGYAAKILKAAGVEKIQGFFTNDTHNAWTSKEIAYGQKISKLTGGAHFIINTATNGHGPKLNPHPVTQGVEDLCNPPGRGLGAPPSTAPGVTDVDALLWTFPPGNSSGSCNGGPPAGSWWPARAEQLSANANGQLGPGYPSKPY